MEGVSEGVMRRGVSRKCFIGTCGSRSLCHEALKLETTF